MFQFYDPRLHARIWRKIMPCAASGCWLWTGATLPGGYGSTALVGVPNRSQLAHRLVYSTLVGLIPEGLQLDHRCRVRCCCNPDHLEPVTQAENIRRGESWRTNGDKTHCPKGHAYAGDNLKIVKGGGRECRECCKTANRNYRAFAKHRGRISTVPLSAADVARLDRLLESA